MPVFENKIVYVTGGANGIGRATCRHFHREGAAVLCLDRDGEAGESLRKELEDRFHFLGADVGEAEAVEAAFAEGARLVGEPDYLVNATGVLGYTDALDTTEDEWDRVLEINLKSHWLCARAAIPGMQRRGAGVIIQVASVNSFHCQRKTLPYAVSKAGLLGLTRSLAVDFGPEIRSLAVCPGTVDTPMLHRSLDSFDHPGQVRAELNRIHLTGRIGRPNEIAALIAYLCGDAAAFMTGQAVRIDGGLGIELGGVEHS